MGLRRPQHLVSGGPCQWSEERSAGILAGCPRTIAFRPGSTPRPRGRLSWRRGTTVELSIERRIAAETELTRDPIGIGIGIGVGLGSIGSAAILAAAGAHFSGWLWLLIPAVVLLVLGTATFAAGLGRRGRDQNGNIINNG